MSQENVELAREAWNAYGERGIDGTLDYYAEDCVCEDTPQGPDGIVYRGREGVRQRIQRFGEFLDHLAIEPVEFIDAGDVVVVVVTSMHGRGKVSGAPVDAPLAFVYGLRDSKVVRDRVFTSRSEALEAAGIAE